MRIIRALFLISSAAAMFVVSACGDDSEAVVSDCDGGRYDAETGLCWQHPKAGSTYAWQPAIDYCADLDLGGHTDWVLPTRQNFIDMLGGCDVDVLGGSYGYCNTCAASATCTALLGADADTYWSSTPGGDGYAWHVDFGNGRVSSAVTDDDLFSTGRCVRPGP